MSLKKWVYFAFINLLIVAFLGLILRYKITFSIPFIDQKYLQHAHSHFALTGWISQLLMVLMASQISKRIGLDHFKKYQWILLLNLVSAFGMLFSFPFQGYGSVSIAFSTLSIIVSYIFAYRLWKDIKGVEEQVPAFRWFKASLLFSVLSSVGIFIMVYLMISKNMNPNYHLAAIYFFLHFQYNGWFVFACFGLLEGKLQGQLPPKKMQAFFRINAGACVPAYFLSAPWLPIPRYIFVLVVLAAIAQLVSWLWVASVVKGKVVHLLSGLPVLAKGLFCLSALAYTLKVLLQVGSTVPALSEIAFGFRPVVVAYLHLVFLCVISLFLMGYVFGWIMTHLTARARLGIVLFVIGIVLNEIALTVQGLFAIGYRLVPYVNEALLGITVLIVLGLLLFNVSLGNREKERT